MHRGVWAVLLPITATRSQQHVCSRRRSRRRRRRGASNVFKNGVHDDSSRVTLSHCRRMKKQCERTNTLPSRSGKNSGATLPRTAVYVVCDCVQTSVQPVNVHVCV